jgi:preprotein translocase subunit SecA
MAKDEFDPETQPEEYAARVKALETQCAAEREKVLEAGGLRIIGTERHESRRIDNQLRGRSGRQGDPGSSKFYLSLEDDLLRIFGSDKILAFMEKWGIEDDEPIEHRWITKSIENAQKKVEGHNFNIRKNLLEYDDVLNQQRQSVYGLRRQALTGENIREMMVHSLQSVCDDIMDDCAMEGVHPEEWDVAGLIERMKRIFLIEWEESEGQIRDMAQSELRDRIRAEAMARYEAKEQELGEESCREVERQLLLHFTDSLWRDHLLAMDRLRDGIGLRGYGQRNPLLEYKKEGFNMFMMMSALRDEAVVGRILRMEPTTGQVAAQAPSKSMARQLASGDLQRALGGAAPEGMAVAPAGLIKTPGRSAPPPSNGAHAPEAPSNGAEIAPPPALQPPTPEPIEPPAPGEAAREFAEEYGLKRNDPCPCGSGKKLKKCCGKVPSQPEAIA